ncbi:MAG TPA: hypothetical protein VFA10_19355 [Ktedonobacteraceae bacterium]|nr:hypothetical protein [Ktedonobacteraceae bacterium]
MPNHQTALYDSTFSGGRRASSQRFTPQRSVGRPPLPISLSGAGHFSALGHLAATCLTYVVSAK